MTKTIENEYVKLIAYHDGKSGSMDDNESFIQSSQEFDASAKAKYRVEEYFDNWIEMYKFEDKWGMYFSIPHGGVISFDEDIDGYLIESYHFIELWRYFSDVKGITLTHEYITDLINYTINCFSNVSSEKMLESK